MQWAKHVMQGYIPTPGLDYTEEPLIALGSHQGFGCGVLISASAVPPLRDTEQTVSTIRKNALLNSVKL